MKRGPWFEFDTDDPDELVLVHPGWTNDRETLVLATRETGWFTTNREVLEAVERATLNWGWIGENEDGELRVCQSDGAVSHGDPLTSVSPVTFARLGST